MFGKWQAAVEGRIKKKYPRVKERQKYKLYHELNGSSWDEATSPYFDFPDECSILVALEELRTLNHGKITKTQNAKGIFRQAKGLGNLLYWRGEIIYAKSLKKLRVY